MNPLDVSDIESIFSALLISDYFLFFLFFVLGVSSASSFFFYRDYRRHLSDLVLKDGNQ
jgi:hypothetical protein